jgi:hypothetical protein
LILRKRDRNHKQIHLLLLFLMFYQFTERGKQMFVDTVQWRFALLAVLNQAFVWLWYKHCESLFS